ncbi:RTX toxin [Peteryoungia ipomoeae]|uniref:RTX toxin n=1 Tax=Peteryoungia ipomoeae TaxID=1210932 RepID=A0A4S8P7S6_9HYPH|nr:RTX toxin [Peteryoungia ipomoeae]THV25691.1 RTX toxin [Peteryoungia ipomoeae]
MTTINSFYRNPNAASYMMQLFTASPSQAPVREAIRSVQSQSVPSETAGQRALSRIIEILALRDAPLAQEPAVDGSLGHITAASGSDGDDKMTFSSRSVFGVETGAGADLVTAKAAYLASVSLGEGADTLRASGSFIDAIELDVGDDVAELSARLIMNVSGGDGDDQITAAGYALIGIDGGDGADKLTLEGTRIFASGGRGDDTVVFKRTDTSADNAIAEYAFARGDGRDKIASNGALTIRFDGYSERDVQIVVQGETLTASFAGSQDALSVTLDKGALKGGALPYSFGLQDGQTILRIG